MSLSKNQISELGGKITVLLFTTGLIYVFILSVFKYAESNHKDPIRPDYKIETDRGIEYPKY